MRLNIGQRIFAVTASSLVPIIAVLIFNEVSLRISRETEVHKLALSTALQAALEMERLTTGSEGTLRAIATAPAIRSFDPDRCSDYLSQLSPTLPQFVALTVFDLEGFVRCRSDSAVNSTSFADRPYFQEAIDSPDKLVVSTYTISRFTGDPALPLAIAVLNDQGDPIGVLASGLDLDWLGETLVARQLPTDASLTIADRNGTIIGREPFAEDFVGTVIPESYRRLVDADAPGTINVVSQDGTDRILGYVPVRAPPQGLYVSAGIARSQAFAAIDAATWRNLTIGLLAVVLALLLTSILGRSLVKGPVKVISSTLQARRDGDEGRRTGLSAEDGDLEALGAEFDAYMDELTESRLERERSEEHRSLLTHEMSHRMKNMIATIQAIATQTFRQSNNPQESLSIFNSRLGAIAQAQQLLLFDHSGAATVREAIESSITLFETQEGDRFSLSGPEVHLRPQAALSLAMAIHELCTNAVKYGALSTDYGHVDINWKAQSDGTFTIEWAERGGPKVVAPSHRGFGSKMIERLLSAELGGEAVMEFLEGGLRCRIRARNSAPAQQGDDKTQ